MDRDLDLLRKAATDVAADLDRVSGARWQCQVGDDYVLTVTFGDASESVLLERRVEDEEWYLAANLTREQQAEALEADAAEAVADETLEVLRVGQWPAPQCGEHGRALMVCSGTWLCNGPPAHDVAAVGTLGV
ncbi:MAG: hypothetical protein M3O32_13715 [Actinomycetota bacterium]|nr:hypothetical protein [Actinomycetota bacterium]